MPLPDNMTQVRVGEAEFVDSNGALLTGKVLTVTPTEIRLADGTANAVIYSAGATATVDDAGAAWVTVPATDATVTDSTFNLKVQEPDGRITAYFITAPSTAPVETIDDVAMPTVHLSTAVKAGAPVPGILQIAQGPAGLDLIVEHRAPSSDDGVNGQGFLDTLNGVLYGPKTAGAWGTGLTLTGGGSGGISESDADARYILQTAIDAHGGVAGLDAGGDLKLAEFPASVVRGVSGFSFDAETPSHLIVTYTDGSTQDLGVITQGGAGSDSTPPKWTGTDVATVTATGQTSVTFSWPAASDNVGVTGYNVSAVTGAGDNQVVTPVQTGLPATTLQTTVQGLTAATDYLFWVTAVDASGNESSDVADPGDGSFLPELVVSFSTDPLPDTTAPTVPGRPSQTLLTPTSINLQWTGSTDNQSGVAGYNVHETTLGLIGSNVQDLFLLYTGLSASTPYTFTVTAVDNAGNESGASLPLSVTTPATSGGGANLTFIGATSTHTTVVNQNPFPAIPPSTAVGDLMVCRVAQSVSTTTSTPTGWTQRSLFTDASVSTICYIFWKIAAAADLNTTPTSVCTNAKSAATMSVWRNTDTTTPIPECTATYEASSLSTHAAPSVTPTVDNSVVYNTLAEKDPTTANITTISVPSGWLQDTGFAKSGGTSQLVMYPVSTRTLRPSGTAVTGITFTCDQPASNVVKVALTIAPSGAGGSGTAPTQVVGLTAGNITDTSIQWMWSQATDDSGIDPAYNMYQTTDGTSTPTAPSTGGTPAWTTQPGNLVFTMRGLAPATTYAMRIGAIDADGNEGTRSGNVRATTTSGGGGGGGGTTAAVITGINVRPDDAQFPDLNCQLGDRTAANGWASNAGNALVTPTGTMSLLKATRIYYSGDLPTTFSASDTTGGSGTNTAKRVNICFKLAGQPAPTFVTAGSADVQIMRYINSIPANWEVAFTWHHEPNAEITATGNWSAANYMAAQQRIGALIEGRNPTTLGQVAKNGSAAALSLNAGVNLYTAPCFSWPRGSASSNKWAATLPAVPHANTMDAKSKLCGDLYGGYPPNKDATLASVGGTVDALYPAPHTVFGYFFDTVWPTLGYDAPGHGYIIGEWEPDPRDADGPNWQGQADSIKATIQYFCNLGSPSFSAPQAPYWLSFWENKYSGQGIAGGAVDMWTHPKGRSMVAHMYAVLAGLEALGDQ